MIKCKQDLINTYIENDKGELRDLYIKASSSFCIDVYDENSDSFHFIECCSSHNGIALYGSDEFINLNGESAKLTIADFQPEVKLKTKVDYVEVDVNSDNGAYWECARDFAEGLVGTFWRDDFGGEKRMIQDNEQLLDYYTHKNLYRRVETEVTWQDELKDYLCNKMKCHESERPHFEIADGVLFEGSFSNSDFIAMCHLVASMTDKP